MRGVLIAVFMILSPVMAVAQELPKCPPAPALESSTISVETKAAADLASKLLGKLGVDINVRKTRDSVLKDNPRADQVIIVRTMINVQCEIIWSDSNLSGAEKSALFNKMMLEVLTAVQGPAPVARTDRHTRSHDGDEGAIVVASADDISAFLLLAQNEAALKLPEPQTGFLRDPPFYVNDSNKYFVIVGSAPTEEAGIRLMNRLKTKAPQHDFALYQPYGQNPNFAVMMATWVPRDVALEAQRLARRDVASDAYLWACRSSGDSC